MYPDALSLGHSSFNQKAKQNSQRPPGPLGAFFTSSPGLRGVGSLSIPGLRFALPSRGLNPKEDNLEIVCLSQGSSGCR